MEEVFLVDEFIFIQTQENLDPNIIFFNSNFFAPRDEVIPILAILLNLKGNSLVLAHQNLFYLNCEQLIVFRISYKT